MVRAGTIFIKIAKLQNTRSLQARIVNRDRDTTAIQTNSLGDVIINVRPDEERNDDTTRPLRFHQRGKLTGRIIRNA